MRCRRTKAGRLITLIYARSRQGRYVEALDLHRDMQRRGHPPGRCGRIDSARKMFDLMPERDTVIWNSMLSGYARLGLASDAMCLFRNMILGGLVPDGSTWNSLISGFSSSGDVEMALFLCRSMGTYGIEPDVISWTCLICGFVQSFRNHEAFRTFRRMMAIGSVRPSSVTISSLLPACANVADEKFGRALHGYSVVIGVEGDLFVGSSLVDMYAKCGYISEAVKIFSRMCRKSTVSWNSMIFGYANNGYCGDAINLYYQMGNDGAKPDHLTFTATLTACSHAGMVDVGKALFDNMQKEHGIKPRLEHYACMVDLVGRAGDLVEAYDLIKEMPMKPDLFVWGALLGACRNHGNVELAELAASHLLELETEKCGSYLMISNILAASGRWEDSLWLKMVMKKQKLEINPGCSWITAA